METMALHYDVTSEGKNDKMVATRRNFSEAE